MNWTPTVNLGEWGRLQVVINDLDVTFFRGVPVEVISWSSGDPFDDAAAVLRFPQISPFEEIGTGELAWLTGHSSVDIKLVRPNNTRLTLWEGMVASIEDDTSETTSALSLQCIGALYQLDYYMRAPKNLSEGKERLYERAIIDEFHPPSTDREALKTSRCRIVYPPGMKDTGWKTRYSGSWEKTLTGYIQRLLADMVHNPGFIRDPGSPAIPGIPGINAVQDIVLAPEHPPFPWGNSYPSRTLRGTVRWQFRGAWTPRRPYNVNAAGVKSALQALSSIDEVNVTGNGTAGSPWRVTFVGAKVRQRSQPRIKMDHSDLRHNHAVTRVTIVQTGEAGVPGQPAVPPSAPEPWEGQWTLLKDQGRRPILKLRDEETVHWTITAGAPGVAHNLKSDYSQAPNVIYGEGTDESATTWRNSVVVVDSKGESQTNHYPLAWEESTYPARKKTSEDGEPTTPRPSSYSRDNVRVEIIQKYGAGVSLLDARRSADQQLQRESDPGWFGTITLTSDPQEGSRFEIKAGTNIRLRHFRFHVPKDEDDENPDPDKRGILLHVAQAETSFDSSTVTLTVDSKFRDLATLANLIERSKSENQNPAKMLMANRESGNTDDTKFPWDYTSGSGSIPRASRAARHGALPRGRPDVNPTWFVFVPGSQSSTWRRWAIVPVLAAGKGSVSRTEIRAFRSNGQPLRIPFHVGVYQMYVTEYSMPKFPFSPGAFQQPQVSGEALSGYDPSAAVLWGQQGQRAGYWPGLESEGNPATGVLIDEGTWQFQLPEGENLLWVAIYAETNAYFQGRFYHGVQ